MYCKKCGKELKESDSFCSSCGNSVEEVKKNNNSSSASVVFAVIAILTIWIPIVCIPCAIAAIVLGKKNDNRGGMVVGIISLILSLIFTLIVVLLTVFAYFVVSSDSVKHAEEYADKFRDEFSDKIDDFEDYFDDNEFDLSNHSFIASDGSVLVLNSDKSYAWYGKDKELNYSLGKYSEYNGLEAVNYIATHLSEFGMTYDKQMKFFDDDKYELGNYYLLILECNKKVVDGKESSEKEEKNFYYGFYDDNSLKLIDIKTGENKNFVLSDNNKNDGTV